MMSLLRRSVAIYILRTVMRSLEANEGVVQSDKANWWRMWLFANLLPWNLPDRNGAHLGEYTSTNSITQRQSGRIAGESVRWSSQSLHHILTQKFWEVDISRRNQVQLFSCAILNPVLVQFHQILMRPISSHDWQQCEDKRFNLIM